MAEQLTLSRGSTVVLIMDYQNRQLSSFSETFQKELLARANTVLAKARTEHIPVIYVEVQRGERTPETEINSSILPQPGETVLTKHRVGPFSTTILNDILNQQGIKTLILMGISTSGCVLSTVRWAADVDYQLIVVSDCCADRDDEIQRVLMGKIFPRQASVVSSQQVIQAMGNAQ